MPMWGSITATFRAFSVALIDGLLEHRVFAQQSLLDYGVTQNSQNQLRDEFKYSVSLLDVDEYVRRGFVKYEHCVYISTNKDLNHPKMLLEFPVLKKYAKVAGYKELLRKEDYLEHRMLDL